MTTVGGSRDARTPEPFGRPRVASLSDAMGLALEASEAAAGHSTPNPPVGAVVLDVDGHVVSIGATEPAGGRHAEVVALDAAGSRAAGGTIVVTLEPCAHTGRTGPCTERILDAGIATVAFGCADPTPTAAGGAERLRARGLTVVHDDDLRRRCEDGPLRAWLHRQRAGRPLVTWKYAATLDGFVAASDGTSQWITGPGAREHAHRRRAQADAVLVGTGTLRSDDPALTARSASGAELSRSPLACVMGESAVPEDARVRRSSGGFRHLATRDPHDALRALDDCLHVILEGGPTVAAAFVEADLVDEVDAYIAPMILGSGRKVLDGYDVGTLSEARRFRPDHREVLGPDTYLRLVRDSGPGDDHTHTTDGRSG